MKSRRIGPGMIGILMAGIWGVAGLVPATGQQEEPLRIRTLEHRLLQTPNVQMQTDGRPPQWRGRPSSWLQIECVFEMRADGVEELEFTYYVLMRSDDREQPFRLLREQVTYVHVPRDRANAHYSWLYLHPHLVQRFGSVEGVAVEVRSRGRPVAGTVTPQQDYRAWIDRLPAESGWLQTPDQTPFMLYAPSRLLRIKRN